MVWFDLFRLFSALNDTKFTLAFDNVFQAMGIDVINMPLRAPNANAYAERWVRTVRTECLDRLFILNEGHLRRVLREYVDYYNWDRPHQGIQQQIPIAGQPTSSMGELRCRDILSGLIHDYYRAAA